MIFDLILLVIQGVLNILLAPLSVINIGVDFLASIPAVSQFFNLIAYVLPWDNILPLIILTVAIFGFRVALAGIRSVISIATLRGG